MNEQNKPTVKSIDALFKEENLTLPDYQRPYKWQTSNVRQLLDDISENFNQQKDYRIGTVILHRDDKGKLHIVDGQQRLTTLSLLLKALQVSSENHFFTNVQFNHIISFKNIYENNKTIRSYCEDIKDKEAFSGYILKQCEVVVITLTDIDEAFQFFDSQNARGKPLAPYDLLKAYHLRAYPEDDSRQEKIVHWEEAVESKNDLPNLDLTISKLLFRLRRWGECKRAETFTNDELYVFKGIGKEQYPYLKLQRAAYESSIRSEQNDKDEFTYQVHQPMLNGRFFFDYVEHYRQLYAELFYV